VAASGCKWLQVAASGCKWLQVAASGCISKWLQVTAFSKIKMMHVCSLSECKKVQQPGTKKQNLNLVPMCLFGVECFGVFESVLESKWSA